MARWLWVAVAVGCGEADTDKPGTETGGEEPPPPPPPESDTGEPPIDGDGDGFAVDVDCDDAAGDIFPGAPDVCGDDRVTDCDRTSDDGLVTVDGAATYDDLQNAIDAAGPGAELLVCAGTWVGPFTANDPLTLRSHQGRDLTVLSGDLAGSALRIPGGSAVIGFTIREGQTTQRGGGVSITGPGAVTLEDCLVDGNRADLGGGVYVPTDATLTLLAGTEVRDNVAQTLGGGVYCEQGAVDLGDGLVEANTAPVGAGVALVDAELEGGTVSANVSQGLPPYYDEAYGGGLYTYGDCSVLGTTVVANEANVGAGAYAGEGSLVLTDVSVVGNATSAYGLGGGICASSVDVELVGVSEIAENEAYFGGGAFLDSATLTGGTVRDNGGTDGGGIWAYQSLLFDLLITGNTADSGGGVYHIGWGLIAGATIEANDGGKTGGGIYTPAGDDDDDDDTDTDTTALTVPPTTTTGGYGGEGDGELMLLGTFVRANEAGSGAGIYAGAALSLEASEVSENVSTNGAAGITVVREALILGSSVVRNQGGQAGGAELEGNVQLSSVSSDWGEGANDNTPNDVWLGASGVDGYGPGATFDCTRDGCSPLP